MSSQTRSFQSDAEIEEAIRMVMEADPEPKVGRAIRTLIRAGRPIIEEEIRVKQNVTQINMKALEEAR